MPSDGKPKGDWLGRASPGSSLHYPSRHLAAIEPLPENRGRRIGALIWSRFDKEEPTLSARREIVATITVYVKLKGDDFAKSIAASEAIDDGASLTIRDGDRVVARFTIERVEHWYSEPLQS